MRAAAIGAFAGILGLVAAGPGQPPVPAPPAPPAPPVAKADTGFTPDPAVTALVRNLGAEQYQVREKAGRDLEALGDKALPQLRKALAEADTPEVSRRLVVLVRKMDYDRLVNPRRVTLATKTRTVKEAFDEVARQTGYRIEYQSNGPAADTKHSIGFDNVPFWQAADTLADLAGATINSNGYDDDTVMVNNFSQAARSPFVTYVGPFKVAATNVSMNRNLALVGNDPRGIGFNRPSESINLMFNLYAEPKNPLLGMALQPVVVSAEDELGQSMAPPRANDGLNQPFGGRVSYYGGGGYRSYQLNGSLNLVRGGREAKTMRSVKAKVGVNLLSAVVPEVTVRDPLKAKNLKASGRTIDVEVDSVVAQNGGFSASMTVRKQGVQDPNFPDYNWSNNIWQKVELFDEKGGKYRCFGPNSMNNNPGWVTMTLHFQATDRRGMQQKLGPPARLVVNEWVQATHEITFDLRDVPLP